MDKETLNDLVDDLQELTKKIKNCEMVSLKNLERIIFNLQWLDLIQEINETDTLDLMVNFDETD